MLLSVLVVVAISRRRLLYGFKKVLDHLRRGKQYILKTVHSGDGILLTLNQDVVNPLKDYIEDLLNATDLFFSEKAGPEDSGMGSHFSEIEVANVVKKHFGGKALGVDEICLEFLKALDVVGL